MPLALASGYLSRGAAVNCITQSLLVAAVDYGIAWAVTRGERLPKRRSRGCMLVALLVIVLATENIPKTHGEVDRLSNYLAASSAFEEQQATPVHAAANTFDNLAHSQSLRSTDSRTPRASPQRMLASPCIASC